jgi:hypothetical protein
VSAGVYTVSCHQVATAYEAHKLASSRELQSMRAREQLRDAAASAAGGDCGAASAAHAKVCRVQQQQACAARKSAPDHFAGLRRLWFHHLRRAPGCPLCLSRLKLTCRCGVTRPAAASLMLPLPQTAASVAEAEAAAAALRLQESEARARGLQSVSSALKAEVDAHLEVGASPVQHHV